MTRQQLSDALKEQMKKKPLNKITVNDLVTACGMNRKTFYYHFEDIYALLKWTLEQDTLKVIQQYDLLLDLRDVFLFVIEYIKENDHIINCAYDSLGRDGLKQFLYMDLRDVVKQVILEVEEQAQIALEDSYRELLCSFYCGGCAEIMIDALREHKDTDPEKLADSMEKLITDSLTGIIRGQKQA